MALRLQALIREEIPPVAYLFLYFPIARYCLSTGCPKTLQEQMKQMELLESVWRAHPNPALAAAFLLFIYLVCLLGFLLVISPAGY